MLLTEVLRVKSLTPAMPAPACGRKRFRTAEGAERSRWAMSVRAGASVHITWCPGCQAWHLRRER